MYYKHEIYWTVCINLNIELIKLMVLSSLYQTIKNRWLNPTDDIGIKNNQQFYSSLKGAANLHSTSN